MSFDDHLAQLKQRQQQQDLLEGSLSDAATVNPDSFAEQIRLSRAAQVSIEAVPEYEDIAKKQQLLNQSGVMTMWKESPTTAAYLSDPNRAKLSHDDIPALKDFEQKTRELRTTQDIFNDVNVTVMKGMLGVPESFVGLADILSGGRAGKALQDYAGINFKEGQDMFSSLYSPAQQEAFQKVDTAKGFFPTAKTVLENPSVLATNIGQSLPQMAGGAGLGRQLLKWAPKLAAAYPELAPIIASAFGEGTMQAGSSAEQFRQESKDGLITGKQTGAAVASGAIDTIISFLGGKVASRLGLTDVDTLLVSGKASAVATKRASLRFLGGAASEGVLEELPQSTQEQMLQNFGGDKPLFEGVDKASVLGLFSGMVMGGGANLPTPQERGTNAAQQAIVNTQIAAEQSRLLERSPESFIEFAQRSGDREGISHFYLQADSVIQAAINSGMTEDQVPAWAAQYGVTPEDLTTAIQTNGLLQMDYGKVAAGFNPASPDEVLRSLQTEMLLHPDALPASRLEEGVKAEAEHFARLDELYQQDRDRKISMDDVDAWEQAILDNPDLGARVKPESLVPMVAWANTLSTLTGTPAIDHLNRILTPSGLQAMKYADWQQGQKEGEPSGEMFQGALEDAKVTDPALLAELESGETVKAYRAMQLIDGKLYPPMSASVGGVLRSPTEIGVWEQAAESPELADDTGHFKLEKGNKKSLKARYNPYFHTSNSPLNDQFSEAYNRPNLVTVEAEIPKSELTSGYQAEKAKDSVGEMAWHSGPVSSKLPPEKQRKVTLSRYAKVVRIVPDSEVASHIGGLLEGENLSIPENVVTPSLKEELSKRGVNFTPMKPRAPLSQSKGQSFSGMSEQAQAIADELNLTLTEGAIAPTVLFSSRTWTPDEKGQIRELAASMGIEEGKVDKWMFDIDNAMARVLADPSLDFIAEAADLYSALKPNSDPHYTVSLDFSTLCRKRYELMATIEAIQNLTGRALTKDTWVEVRAMLDARGYNVSCGACYVDSKRMEAGKFVNQFIDSHPDEDPKQFLSQSGVDQLKRDNPKLYAEFKKVLGSNNAKTPESRTDYHGEIRWYFTEGREQDMPATQLTGKATWTTKENPKRGKARVEAMNKKSGLRWQSWSDFEVPHLMDAMQAILDMHMAGLMGHAYTKVPDFVLAMGKTGLMVNMSLIAKGTGLTEDGKLVFDTKEGMPFDVAMELRDAHEMTAGTIAIGISNDHIKALLADPRIDYVIPYHASGLSKEIAKKFNMDGWEDYTITQSEDIADYQTFHQRVGKDNAKLIGLYKAEMKKIEAKRDFTAYRKAAKAAGLVGIDTTEYWDDTKSGPENSALYLAMAAERGIAPKFRGHEYSNGRTLADLTGEEGYWKLLIDRKMYDHKGRNIIQAPVKPEYDDKAIQDIYDRGSENPTPNAAVPEVVNEMAGKRGYTGPLFQEQQNPLGATVPGAPNLVTLFETADKSTFLHESGHIFLNDLKYVAETMGVQTEVWAGVQEWLGVGEDGVITKAMHEKFAEHFEVYLQNGRAPSITLRDAFRKFKTWLTSIYDTVKSPRSGQRAGVKVSPEIAELFDRMLATEQEIQAARESSALIAMLSDKDLSEAGDGTAQIEAYRKIVQQSEESARERRDKYKLMGLPERQAAWKKQARAEVKAIPIYAAVDAIKAAGGVTRASIEQQFGKMSDNPSLYRNAGLNVNVAVAEHTPYENAAAFVEDLRNSTPRQVWIDKRVAELETIHDMSQDTQEAIRTASLRRMMEVESQWLARKAVNKTALPRETLRKWAEGKVAGMAPKQIRAISKLLSESKQHRQKAILAAKQGNWEVALKENEQARMTEALIAESYRAMKGLDKVQANWKKIAKWTNDNKNVKVGEDFRDQINRILTQYGIAARPFDPNATNLHAFVAGLAEGDLDGIGTALPEWIGAQVWDAKNMTWGQIQELNSALKFLYGHGREEVEGRKLTNGQRVSDKADEIRYRMTGLQFAVNEAKEALKRNAQRVPTAMDAHAEAVKIREEAEASGDKDEIKAAKSHEASAKRKIEAAREKAKEQLPRLQKALAAAEKNLTEGKSPATGLKNLPDLKSNATRSGKIIQGIQRGYRKFFANTAILRFIAKRADGYGKGIGPSEQLVQDVINGMGRVNDAWEAMQKLIEPELKILFKDGQTIYTDIPIPAVMKKKGEVWTKEKVVTAMLNTGNDGNLQRLMDGLELDKQTIDLMAGKLTKAEWQAIQNIWNGANTLWPQIAAVHERLNFFRPAKIDPRPMSIQAADGPIDLEGGYYPIAYDKDKSRKAREHGEKNDILDKQEMILQKPIPKAGATKARSATVTRPLHLSLAVLGQHFTDMLKYIHLSEVVRDADRVFQNKDLLAQMENVFGQDMVDMIRPTLTNVLRPAPSDLGVFEKSRVLMSMYYMGYNAWTALQNVTGVFPMIHKAGAANYLNGIKHVIGNPLAAHKAMLEASAYMRLRENNIERDMKKQLRDFNTAGVEINGKRYTYDDVKSLGFAGIRLIDGIVALPAWWGVYNAQIEEHGDVQKAVEAADAAVNQALGSGLAIDHTGFGRHPFFSLLAPFMSFASTQQEVLATTNEAWKQGRMSTSDFLYGHLMTWLAPAILSTFLQGALMYGIAGALGGGDDKRKKKGLSDYMTDMISYRLMGIPFVRDAYNSAIQGFEKKAPVTSARMPVTEGYKMLQQAAYRIGAMDGSEKTTKATMWATAELASLGSGIPVTRIYERWMKGQKDIESGRGWWGNHFIPQEKKK